MGRKKLMNIKKLGGTPPLLDCNHPVDVTLSLSGSFFHPQPPSLLILLSKPGSERKGNLILLTKGVKALETAVGAIFAPTRFSLVRISNRDLVADRNPY